MKGVKLCGLLSVLFIIFGLSFVVSSDVNALQHTYDGIMYDAFQIPVAHTDSSGRRYLNWSGDGHSTTTIGSALSIWFEGDALLSSDDWSSLSNRYSTSRLGLLQWNYSDLRPIWQFESTSTYQHVISSNLDLFHPLWDSSTLDYLYQLDGYDISSQFSLDSVPPASILQCGKSNGAVCPGLWNVREYISDQILPNSYSSDGFYLKSKAIDSEGFHYSNTFSFSDMFIGSANYIPAFSSLQIPLHNRTDYFLNSDNLHSGRHFDFNGSFEFDGSFEWNPNISSNGSSFKINLRGLPLYGPSDAYPRVEQSADCSTNLITISGLTRLDFSCPIDLSTDYLYITPYITIDGNHDFVWRTDKKWRFANVFLTTDYDSTPGESFNSVLTGGGTIPGDAKNNFDSDNVDFLSSLANLFRFDIFFPFAPIFNLFSSGDQCASIPTIAGMLHSDETTVCSWFPSNVRSVLTPVIGLFSLMLVFGFVVRWLSSSSGNFIEDSSINSKGGK